MAVFPSRSDFKLADVTRLRDGDLAMEVMPEKAGYGQYAPTYKDVAFLYEAVLERQANASSVAYLVNGGVVTLSPPNALSGAGEAIRRLLTSSDAYRYRLLSWDGMDPDSVDGLIVDELTTPVTDADIRKAMTGGDDETAFVHNPRLPLPLYPYGRYPFRYPVDAVRDLYWCIMHMDAAMCYPAQSIDDSGIAYTRTSTSVIRDYDAQSGQWSERTETSTYSGTGLDSEYKSADRTVEQSGDIEETTYTTASVHSGQARLTYRVEGNGDVVDSAYAVLTADTQASRNDGGATQTVYSQKRFVIVRLGAPSAVSADKALVSWDIPASAFISASDGLRFDLPPLDQSVPSSSVAALRYFRINPVFAVVRFAYRTSLSGVSWGYEPDWDANLP
jgi:hypothetical protein